MKFVVCFLSFLFAFSAGLYAKGDCGWIDLITEDLSNFETLGNWKVDDAGVLTLEPREGESGWKRYDAYLWLKKEYADFEMSLEFNLVKGGNSGLFFRVFDKASPVKKGMEVQIRDGMKKEGKPGAHDMAGIIALQGATKYNLKAPGKWNSMTMKAVGQTVTISVNGEVVNEVDLSKGNRKDHPLKGYISLQDHGGPLTFRNVRIRELE